MPEDNIKIIRGNGVLDHMMTACLAIDWGIRRCAVMGCEETRITAIMNGVPGPEEDEILPAFGLCEKHYQQGNVEGGTTMELDLNVVYHNPGAEAKFGD